MGNGVDRAQLVQLYMEQFSKLNSRELIDLMLSRLKDPDKRMQFAASVIGLAGKELQSKCAVILAEERATQATRPPLPRLDTARPRGVYALLRVKGQREG